MLCRRLSLGVDEELRCGHAEGRGRRRGASGSIVLLLLCCPSAAIAAEQNTLCCCRRGRGDALLQRLTALLLLLLLLDDSASASTTGGSGARQGPCERPIAAHDVRIEKRTGGALYHISLRRADANEASIGEGIPQEGQRGKGTSSAPGPSRGWGRWDGGSTANSSIGGSGRFKRHWITILAVVLPHEAAGVEANDDARAALERPFCVQHALALPQLQQRRAAEDGGVSCQRHIVHCRRRVRRRVKTPLQCRGGSSGVFCTTTICGIAATSTATTSLPRLLGHRGDCAGPILVEGFGANVVHDDLKRKGA